MCRLIRKVIHMFEVEFDDVCYLGMNSGISKNGYEYNRISFTDYSGEYYNLFIDKPECVVDRSFVGRNCSLVFEIHPSYKGGVRFKLVSAQVIE